MLDLVLAVLLAVLFALLALVVLWAALALLGIVAGIELINVVLARLGFSRPSAEGHTPGQRHPATVTSAFRLVPSRGRGEGTVRLHGEIWNADCRRELIETLRPGASVTVVYGDDLRVRVERLADAAGDPSVTD